MFSLNRGFTLVELIIVTSIIGILASVGLVGWSNLATSTRDKVRADDTQLWASTFELYRGRYAAYPVMPVLGGVNNNKHCLGRFADFSSRCGQYPSTSSSKSINAPSATMLANVEKIGREPQNSGGSIGNAFVGPFVYLAESVNTSTGDITVDAFFVNFFERSCSANKLTDISVSPNTYYGSNILPNINAMLSGSGYSGALYTCYLQKTYTYNPN